MMNGSEQGLIRSTSRLIAFVVPRFLPTRVHDAFNKVQASACLVTSEIQRLSKCMFAANVVTLSSLHLESKQVGAEQQEISA